MNLSMGLFYPVQKHALTQVWSVDKAQEAKCVAEVSSGVIQQAEVFLLLAKQCLLRDPQGIEKDDSLVIEKSVREWLQYCGSYVSTRM